MTDRKTSQECFQCGKCCQNHTVLITFYDVRKIHKNLPNKKISDYISIFEEKKDFKENYLLDKYFKKIKYFENNEEIFGYLGLKFKKIDESLRMCVFFDDQTKLCSIHKFKPYICRCYPHTLLDNNKLVWNKARCQSSWAYKDNLAEKKELHKKAQIQYKKFEKEIVQWNNISEDTDIQNLLDFIVKKREDDDF